MRSVVLLSLLIAAAGDVARAEEPATATVRATLEQASRITAGDKTARRGAGRGARGGAPAGRHARHGASRPRRGLRRATPAQQEEFLRLFDELVVRSYLQKLLLFRQPKFRFGTESQTR